MISKEKLVSILAEELYLGGDMQVSDPTHIMGHEKAADRILAALKDEQQSDNGLREAGPTIEYLTAAGCYLSIHDERISQDKKWGKQNHDDLKWLAILMEEVGEVSMALLDNESKGHPECLRNKELIQVAAVVVAWMECLARNGKGAKVWEQKSLLSRHPATTGDPLAVLADRKGYWKVGFVSSCDSMAGHYWTCNIQKTSFDIRVDKQRDYDFVAPTYTEAESKARAYLSTLPDREDK